MSMDTQPADPKKYFVILGIEFGTAFSSCSYALSDNDEIIDIVKWPRNSYVHPKVPTLCLYHSGSTKLVAWGEDARKKAFKGNNNDLLLSRFELQPDKNLSVSPLPYGLTVLDVIRDYLEALHSYVCKELQRALSHNYDQSQFRYCLTVPDMWSDQTKAAIREAAIRANIINRWDHPDRLMLISEHEATALYCERRCETFNIGHGQRFLMCIAGERTVDIAVLEIDEIGAKRRKKVATSSRDTCGSNFLDVNMHDFLKDKYYRYRKVKDTGMRAMMDTFIDIIKPCFDGDEDQYLTAPMSWDVIGIDDPDKGIFEDGTLTISCHELRQHVFEPVCNQVISLIDEQIQTSATQIVVIFLVGDFGQSDYLFRRLEDEFYSRVDVIGVPPRPELAAVRGAAYFGLDHPIVSEPVSTNSPEPQLPSTRTAAFEELPQRRKFIDWLSKKK